VFTPFKKWIGFFAVARRGLNALVFAGGIRENASPIRENICEGLGSLGVELNKTRNAECASVISTEAGRVRVHLIRTDGEWMIARSVLHTCLINTLLKTPSRQGYTP